MKSEKALWNPNQYWLLTLYIILGLSSWRNYMFYAKHSVAESKINEITGNNTIRILILFSFSVFWS